MKTYNGWTNWETWLTDLNFGDGLIYDFIEDTTATDIYGASQELKEYVTNFIDDTNPDLEGNFFLEDILRIFLDKVNWYEITEHYFEEAKSEDEEE